MVLLLRQLLGEGDVVEQHDALADDEREHDRAAGEEHHTVHPAAVEDVVQDAQGADGCGQIGRERGQRAGDGAAGVPAVARASACRSVAGRGVRRHQVGGLHLVRAPVRLPPCLPPCRATQGA